MTKSSKTVSSWEKKVINRTLSSPEAICRFILTDCEVIIGGHAELQACQSNVSQNSQEEICPSIYTRLIVYTWSMKITWLHKVILYVLHVIVRHMLHNNMWRNIRYQNKTITAFSPMRLSSMPTSGSGFRVAGLNGASNLLIPIQYRQTQYNNWELTFVDV